MTIFYGFVLKECFLTDKEDVKNRSHSQCFLLYVLKYHTLYPNTAAVGVLVFDSVAP